MAPGKSCRKEENPLVYVALGVEVDKKIEEQCKKRGMSWDDLEVAKFHLLRETGGDGGVTPLMDLVSLYSNMEEEQRRSARVMLGKRARGSVSSAGGIRKDARIEGGEATSSASSMDMDSDAPAAVAPQAKPTARPVIPTSKPKPLVTEVKPAMGKEESAEVQQKKQGDKKSSYKMRAPIQEKVGDPLKAVVEAIKDTRVPVRLGDLMAVPAIQRELKKEVTTRRVYEGAAAWVAEEGDDEWDEEPLPRLFADVRLVTWADRLTATGLNTPTKMEGHVLRGEKDSVGVGISGAMDGREGRRNFPEKWKIRPLMTKCPHLREVELVGPDGGIYVPTVPNDDGSQMNLISTSLARAVEKRGVVIDWNFEFDMRSANGQVDTLRGMIPLLPTFVNGVRFEIAALVVGDSAPFAMLWGSPANSSTATKTYRHPISKEMIVKMENPDGYVVYYTAITGTHEHDMMVDDKGTAYKGVDRQEKAKELKDRLERDF
ncbi:hypothetical protein HDU67_000332 [Dinochytrium kinnereticum]|nr:hypothetical protein HDU67_000332 [Dinochytrium kinnereticum]